MPASRGQSLIETLVALSVMVIGIAGAVSLGIISIRAGQTSELDVVAENLAREGIEAARSVRDFNWIQGKQWDTGLGKGTYRVVVGETGDPAAGQVELEKAPGGELLGDAFFHLCRTDKGQYLHMGGPVMMDQCELLGWEETVFNRRVTVDKPGGGADKLRVTCEVRRSGGVGAVTYTVVEDLYNWKPE